MRVLIVNTYYEPEMVGGAEHSVKKLAEQLARMGIECAVLCTGEQDEDCVINGVRIFRRRMKKRSRSIDMGRKKPVEKLVHRIQELGCPQNASAINEVLDAFRPDVIHTNCLYDITPVIWVIAARRGVRVVHTLRDYYLICPRVQLMRRGTSRRCRRPIVVCRMYRMLNRWYSRFVDVVTAPSDFTLSVVLAEGLFRGKQNAVIFNAIEFEKSVVCKEKREQFTALYLGELTRKKGVEWLLEAFDEISDKHFRLMIAGRGELETKIRERAQNDPRIRFLGHLDAHGVDVALNNADVLVCPSLWDEPFGRVVIDAYSQGLPVIASDRGALPEIVEDGKNGIIVPAGDVKHLARAMLTYDRDSELWCEHAQNAEKEMNRFSLEQQARRFLEIYRKER